MSALEKPGADTVTAFTKTTLSPQLLHDLRSPLNQIVGFSEIMIEEADAPRDALVADLRKVIDAGQRILSLIEGNFTTLVENPLSTELTYTEDAPPVFEPRLVHERRVIAPGALLVVDDEEGNRDVLSRRLIHQGHRVQTASNGREALELLRTVEFDVVLLDIMMPDMDGYEVLGHIKSEERLQHIPVIMISALTELQSVVRCIEAGAEDYLAKPFDPTLLKARIAASLGKKRSRDRETDLFAQLQENYKRLQEMEKLRDDMRNMIVHDLRTPLTAVIVGVEMLEKHGELNELQRDMIAIAAGGGRTLLAMINDLLDVEKMEAGVLHLLRENLSASSLIAGALAQVASLAADAQTTLETDIAAALPVFCGDENKLSRTLVNLIANAIKFTRQGTVTVKAVASNTHVYFAVRDTGSGIPREAFERIFEKFGQLDPRNKVGTGLGLAFCKLAVEAHGGRIEVESTPGKGSTFSFSIPISMPAAESREM